MHNRKKITPEEYDSVIAILRETNSFKNTRAVKFAFWVCAALLVLVANVWAIIFIFKAYGLTANLDPYLYCIFISLSLFAVITLGITTYITFGKKNIKICSSCRRIKTDKMGWLPIEFFMSGVTHVHCDVCSGAVRDIMTAGQKEKILSKEDLYANIIRNNDDLRLGDLLIAKGYITRRQLSRALMMQEKYKDILLGDILANQSCIPHEILNHELSEQENLQRIKNEINSMSITEGNKNV